MARLHEYTKGSPRVQQPLLLIQSSPSQSGVPLLRYIITESSRSKSDCHCLLFCLLYRVSDFIEGFPNEHITTHDWTGYVPEYSEPFDVRQQILRAVQDAPFSSLTVAIDSVDALSQDIGELPSTVKFIHTLIGLLLDQQHSTPSQLLLHIHQSTELASFLTQVSLSSSLVHMTVHPPALFIHLATEYLMPPPPSTAESKFWSVFLPIRDRGSESIRLVYGNEGEGSGSPNELVVELVVRGSDASTRRRDVHRLLEGWSIAAKTPCELVNMESLKQVCRKPVEEAAVDVSHNVTFNLELTSAQQETRAQVPLPYVQQGKTTSASITSVILYDPDSADDIDDDDPDEDLDI
ncbi:hypothetical protein AMATHDRAFT_135248 [Amanita thiersii Skay4041]|uniref:Elongator complex protein 5 n=1 Tax=Amanita thiersii Skay4041 TaxID=703135 RepID=A0A2A9P1H3_9AGAR|nr:hypothetical protein AMATHDRAFT_135248 [Amanita thiersii Skay4041]